MPHHPSNSTSDSERPLESSGSFLPHCPMLYLPASTNPSLWSRIGRLNTAAHVSGRRDPVTQDWSSWGRCHSDSLKKFSQSSLAKLPLLIHTSGYSLEHVWLLLSMLIMWTHNTVKNILERLVGHIAYIAIRQKRTIKLRLQYQQVIAKACRTSLNKSAWIYQCLRVCLRGVVSKISSSAERLKDPRHSDTEFWGTNCS